LTLKGQSVEHDAAAAPNIIRILQGLLQHSHCTSIDSALRYGGPQVWRHLATRISAHNTYLGSCMFAMARFCTTVDYRQATWHTAPLWGHTANNPILPITEPEAATLRHMGIHSIGQIYDAGDAVSVHSHMQLRTRPPGVDGGAWGKVAQIRRAMLRRQILREGIGISDTTRNIIRRTGTYSHLNRVLYKEQQAREIKAPPSYFTRRKDQMPLPPVDAYCKAYEKLMACTYTSTAATAFNFAALNRTVWTEKKQSLSGNAGGGRQNEPIVNGTCDLCGNIEDTAHILADCNSYSYRLWERFNTHLTTACRMHKPDNPPIRISFHNIMYFTPIHSLPKEFTTRILALLIEIKRDIYVKRTERCTSNEQAGGRVGGRLYTDQRIDMHISIVCYKLIQLFKVKGKGEGILGSLREVCLGN
jgi:hypothetical protein